MRGKLLTLLIAAFAFVREKIDSGTRDAEALLGAVQKRQEQKFAAADRAMMREVRIIGGGLVMVLIVTLVLTEVHSAAAVDSGPFANVTTSLENTGVSALVLLIVGFLVIAATAIMRFFGGGFGGR